MSEKVKASFWRMWSIIGAVLITLSPWAASTLMAEQAGQTVVNEHTLWSGAILVGAIGAAFFCGIQFYQMSRAVKKVEVVLGLIHAMPCVGHVIGEDGESKLVIIKNQCEPKKEVN